MQSDLKYEQLSRFFLKERGQKKNRECRDCTASRILLQGKIKVRDWITNSSPTLFYSWLFSWNSSPKKIKLHISDFNIKPSL